MPPLSIFDDQAFLISPLEIPVYILELPAIKETFIEGEISRQLKALYPGAPENTVMDYKIYHTGNRNRNARTSAAGGTGLQTAAVFVCSRPVYEICRNLKRPLIPGIALMAEGMHNFGEEKLLAVLCTPQWIEAAFFENRVIRRYGSCPVGSGGSDGPDGLPLTMIAPFLAGPESREISTLFIIAGSGEEQNVKTKKLLNQFLNRVIDIGIGDISIKKKVKNLGTFNDNKTRSLIRSKRSIRVLTALNCVSLFFSLHLVSTETKLGHSRLENYYHEQSKRQDKAEELEREIKELLSRQTKENQDQGYNPHEIISQIRNCLSGAWIKSLVIQDKNFTIEAEGTDSIGVLQLLQASGYFNGLTVHQAQPSKNSGEQFTISGRTAGNEKK
ncbi:MAG: hypothetical protein LBB68_08475 [Treponema sp.]|jgi:hypothetical protein|nr:hypothetical protein [Treponema sp.]